MEQLSRAARWGVPLLTVWSLVVWGSRIRNILRDDGVDVPITWRPSPVIDGLQENRSFFLSVFFILISFWVFRSAYGLWRDGASDPLTCVSGAALTLALANVIVWPIRAYGILGDDWSGAFKAVHTLLATVSVVLGLLVLFHRYGRAGNSRPVRHRKSVADPV